MFALEPLSHRIGRNFGNKWTHIMHKTDFNCFKFPKSISNFQENSSGLGVLPAFYVGNEKQFSVEFLD